MGAPAIFKERNSFIVDRKDMGRADSLRYNVISQVREEAYERAVQTLTNFLEKPSPFPQFRGRIERYIEHSTDLVRAIEIKRSFPGANRLTAARQQDLKLKVKQHIDELVYCLKKIEQVELTLKVEDVRSTVIVIHSLVMSAFALAIVAFLVELSQGLMVTTVVVVDDFFQGLASWLFGASGFL